MSTFYPDGLRICTHDGPWHADDVFAVAVFKVLAAFNGLANVEIRRSRKSEDWDWANVVIDVGGQHIDADGQPRMWFDHHQPGGAGSRTTPFGEKVVSIPFASFGLVWERFGADLVATMLGKQRIESGISPFEIKDQVDDSLVAAIDAIDNGCFSMASADDWVPDFSVSRMISDTNPVWNQTGPVVGTTFDDAVQMAGGILVRRILQVVAAKEAEVSVRTAYATRDDPRILVLGTGMPWQKCLLETLKDSEVLYVVHRGEPSTAVYIATVPTSVGSRTPRKPFPEDWAGKRDSELSGLLGIPGLVFCHNGRFIAGAKNYEAAKQMARTAANL